MIKQSEYFECFSSCLHYFVEFLLCYLLHLFSSDCLQLSQVYSHTIFLFEYMNLLKKFLRRRVFHNVNLSNLENILQGNLRTGRVRCAFKSIWRDKFFINFQLDTNLGGAFNLVQYMDHLARNNSE